MKRAFLSLYLLIVLATLGLGWALDRLWSAHQPEDQPNPPGASLTEMLALATETLTPEDTRRLVERISRQELADIRLASLEDISGERTVARLEAGEQLSFEDSAGNLYHYQKLPTHDQVLIVAETELAESRRLESFLAALFYLALAAVVFFWLWPLTRDLTKLERHAEALGRNPEYPTVEVSGRSAAQRLAQAFNHMARRIQDLLRSQKEMTHAVSHELRTPLARMKFALEIAEGTEDPVGLRNKLYSLKADVAEMEQLVTQLLHYARFERQPELHATPGDMPALIEDLSKRLSGHLTDPPRIELNTAQLHEPMVCDWPLMERALHNLLQNALRYAERHIHVHLYSDRSVYRIEVDDDGPGVPPEERERIFESFVRLREAPERHTAGFGLGLAIVQRVIHWHGGKVQLAEAPLGGARFTLEWPALQAFEPEAEKIPPQ